MDRGCSAQAIRRVGAVDRPGSDPGASRPAVDETRNYVVVPEASPFVPRVVHRVCIVSAAS